MTTHPYLLECNVHRLADGSSRVVRTPSGRLYRTRDTTYTIESATCSVSVRVERALTVTVLVKEGGNKQVLSCLSANNDGQVTLVLPPEIAAHFPAEWTAIMQFDQAKCEDMRHR